jgi:hypothetical protein
MIGFGTEFTAEALRRRAAEPQPKRGIAILAMSPARAGMPAPQNLREAQRFSRLAVQRKDLFFKTSAPRR